MHTCNKCGNTIPTRVKINGIIHVLCRRKYCLTCSPFNQHNTRKLEIPRKLHRVAVKRAFTCSNCLKTRFEKTSGTICASCKAKKQRHEMKEKAAAFLGGKCCVCGYNKCVNVLSFHHLFDKKFHISLRYQTTWEKLEPELKKCILLCSNCHTEVHAGFTVLTASHLNTNAHVAQTRMEQCGGLNPLALQVRVLSCVPPARGSSGMAD